MAAFILLSNKRRTLICLVLLILSIFILYRPFFVFNWHNHWHYHKLDYRDEKQCTEIADDIFGNLVKLRFVAAKDTKRLRHYLDCVSNSALNKACKAFGISNLTSPSLQRRFLNCTGVKILKKYYHEENILLPKQFHNCKKMSFRNSGIPTLLVSWPGSGNSWVRQLLETATGVYTGSDEDCDINYIRIGMLGEGISNENVIAVKVHFSEPKMPKNSKVIYIVRNPFDVFVAEWSRLLSQRQKSSDNSHTYNLKKSNFGENDEWQNFVRKKAHSWRRHVVMWLSSSRPYGSSILVVKFEDLLVDLRRELVRMMEYLKYPYTEKDLNCTVHSNMQGFHRNHSSGTSFEHYTNFEVKVINNQLQLAYEYLKDFNISYEKRTIK